MSITPTTVETRGDQDALCFGLMVSVRFKTASRAEPAVA